MISILTAAVSLLLAQHVSSDPAPRAQEPVSSPQKSVSSPKKYEPYIAGASDEGALSAAAMELPDGFKAVLWAAEPDLANPVCFAIDERTGDIFVSETFRHHAGVEDVRRHMEWVPIDVRNQTVEERLAMMEATFGEDWDSFDDEQERIRLLRDTNGDGTADKSNVYAGGFSEHAAGIAAGLLVRDGTVYYTCIPDVWMLRDKDGDGVAEVRDVMSSGYGVNVSMLGHDLHGLILGPDGRLYFSSGDRGFHVETKEGTTIAHAHTGAVLRCELDGSELEVFATGLRNPQEIAFDDYGNLFTADNNSDSIDQARFHLLPPGSDCGWRYSYQWIEKPVARGPWNAEEMWKPVEACENGPQPKWFVPPIANVSHGPSGLVFDTGIGLSHEWRDHFFLCDFRGGSTYSGILAFDVKPKGAFFELGEVDRFAWKVLPTDVDFAPDGSMLILDWSEGWEKPGKGRIHRIDHAAADDATRGVMQESRERLAAGFTNLKVAELAQLVGSADRRVRLGAQLELCRRDELLPFMTALEEAMQNADAYGERHLLHCVWGLGVAARAGDGAAAASLATILQRSRTKHHLPDRVFAAVARAIGDYEWHEGAPDDLFYALDHPSAFVQMEALHSIASFGPSPPGFEAAVDFLRTHGSEDPVLFHTGASALAGCAPSAPGTARATAFGALISDDSEAVRHAAVVALRRLRSPLLSGFLNDTSPRIVSEATRAIYDEDVTEALAALAARLADKSFASEIDARRVLYAARRIAKEFTAYPPLPAIPVEEWEGWKYCARTADWAVSRTDLSAGLRAEALEICLRWADPPQLDPVTGDWRPMVAGWLDEREGAVLAVLDRIADADQQDAVVDTWLRLVRATKSTAALDVTRRIAHDESRGGAVRASALSTLKELGDESLADHLRRALTSEDAALRAAALPLLASVEAAEAIALVPKLLDEGDLAERRAATRLLGGLESDGAAVLLGAQLERHLAGEWPKEAQLELMRAAEKHAEHPACAQPLDKIRAARAEVTSTLARHLDSLFGGNVKRGQNLFYSDARLQCLRCHGAWAGDKEKVGPDLVEVSKRLDRRQMLEAICMPNAAIAEGYETTALFRDGGGVVAGRIVFEDEDVVRVQISSGELVDVSTKEIRSRRPDLSSMPEDLADLVDRSQMRDLIAFLAQL